MTTLLPLVLLCALLLLPACGSGGSSPPEGHYVPPTIWHVSAATGDDTDPGTQAAPFKTITRALTVARSTDVVQVLPGTYDVPNGEVFPLVVGAGVTLRGDVTNSGGGGSPTEILGGAEPPTALGFPAALTPVSAITLFPLGGASVEGFRIRNTDAVKDHQFDLVLMHSEVTLRANALFGSADQGIYVINGSTGHQITQNQISGRQEGLLFVGGGVGSLVEGNEITGNVYGVVYESPGGDMGGGSTGCLGGNKITCSSHTDVWANGATITVSARNNFWDHAPPTTGAGGGADIYEGGGAAILTTGALQASNTCP